VTITYIYIYIRANRAQYADISFQSINDDDVAEVSLPSVCSTVEEGEVFSNSTFHIGILSPLLAPEALHIHDTPSDVFSTPPQLDGDLITLTLLPRSRWQTLLNLEVIQVGSPLFRV
jgi:U3 small nucleolar RNA-associated protein 21